MNIINYIKNLLLKPKSLEEYHIYANKAVLAILKHFNIKNKVQRILHCRYVIRNYHIHFECSDKNYRDHMFPYYPIKYYITNNAPCKCNRITFKSIYDLLLSIGLDELVFENRQVFSEINKHFVRLVLKHFGIEEILSKPVEGVESNKYSISTEGLFISRDLGYVSIEFDKLAKTAVFLRLKLNKEITTDYDNLSRLLV